MHEDNLLAIRRWRFVRTTQSGHEMEVYLNVAGAMQLTSINQLWVADITYIRLRGEFVYLAVVLDRFSRCVVGWSLDRTLSARLTVRALQQAIEKRQPRPGLVHHSDPGRAVRRPGVCAGAAESRHGAEHEPAGEPIR